MSRDNWEKLVSVVLNRQNLRELAHLDSFNSSISSNFSSRRASDSTPVHIPEDLCIPCILHDHGHDARPIKFEELKKATKNFRPDLILGQGGFGVVYKGWIDGQTLTASKPGSGMLVAVKKRDEKSRQGREEWSKEVHYLSQLRHPNLIKLIGYCSKEDNWILVYEFMPKGSLNLHIFKRGHQSLPWVIRIKVAKDAARALSFLHDRENPIVHRGFRTFAILLDGEFNAKLSDFGLATNCHTVDMADVASTPIMGASGYTAPEYIASGHLTTKCDVYGFGVFLLELLSGRRSLDVDRPREEWSLVNWAMPYLGNKQKVSKVMDVYLDGQYSRKEAYTVATIALLCLSAEPKQRPRMVDVLTALEQL